MSRNPKFYRSMEEFEREELRPHQKIGFTLDDLYHEATFNAPEDDYLDQPKKELDFDS